MKRSFIRLFTYSGAGILSIFLLATTSLFAGGWEENKGQIIDTEGDLRTDVLFRFQAGGFQVFQRTNGFSYVGHKKDSLQYEAFRLDFDFVGGSVGEMEMQGAEPGYSNYYLGHCPEGVTEVRSYRELVLKNIWEGVDLRWQVSPRELKYEFIVHPGASPELIQLRVSHPELLRILSDGALDMALPTGTLREEAPFSYQTLPSRPIETTFSLSDSILHFQTASFDPTQTLVIDPMVLVWSTYFGGSSSDRGEEIRRDSQGDLVVVGKSPSTDFPVSPGAFQTTVSGGCGLGGGSDDYVVVKMDATNGSRIWATYYGGSCEDYAFSMAIDNNDDIIVSGRTKGGTFPITAGAFQNSYPGGTYSVGLVKLNSSGFQVWSTYFGSTSLDEGREVEVDAANFITLAGYTQGSNFPVLGPAFQTAPGGSNDGFVARFTPNGQPVFSTYAGGSASDALYGVAIDDSANMYISGVALSANFPVQNAHQTLHAGSNDMVLMKFDSTGTLVFSTYFGGTGNDQARGCGIDPAGNIYMSGRTSSSDFPVTTGVFDPFYSGGGADVGMAKFNSNGNLMWASYLGGTGGEYGDGDFAFDVANNIYYASNSFSGNFPTSTGAFRTFNSGSNDATVSVISEDGTSMLHSTYIGGSGQEFGHSLVVDAGCFWGTGWTTSSNFPTASAFQSTFAGSQDLIMFHICIEELVLPVEGLRLVLKGIENGVVLEVEQDNALEMNELWLERMGEEEEFAELHRFAVNQRSYVDRSLYPDQDYRYRLAARTPDGETIHSNVVVASISGAHALPVIFPNPSAANAPLQLRVPISAQVQLQITDNLGRQFMDQTYPGPGTWTIPESTDWPAGIYHIQCRSTKGLRWTESWIKR